MSSENPVDPNQSTEQTKKNPTDKNSPIESAVLAVLSSKVEPPPTYPCHEISCDKKRDGWDYAKMVAEFIGLMFLIAYTIYTAGIYRANYRAAQAAHDTLGEIQRQTKLMRQQLVGTQAAVIDTLIEIPETNLQGLSIQIRNTGHVVASDVRIAFKVQKVTVPGQDVVGESVATAEYSIPRLAVFADRWEGQQYPLRVTTTDANRVRQDMTETLRVSGTISYDNGFPEHVGEKTVIPFCRTYLFFKGKTSTAGPSMVNCEIYASAFRDYQENEKRRQQ